MILFTQKVDIHVYDHITTESLTEENGLIDKPGGLFWHPGKCKPWKLYLIPNISTPL